MKLDSAQWQAGGRWIDQQLDFYVARFAAGDSLAKRRQLGIDAPLRKAIDMMNKGQTQKDLFSLAQLNLKPINDAKPPSNQAAAKP